jgi:hypothetical protein
MEPFHSRWWCERFSVDCAKPGEGEEPLSGPFEAVGYRLAFEPAFAKEGPAALFDPGRRGGVDHLRRGRRPSASCRGIAYSSLPTRCGTLIWLRSGATPSRIPTCPSGSSWDYRSMHTVIQTTILRPVRRRIISAESYARCGTVGLGGTTETSRGGRKVRAMATAPRPMPNEPI